MIASRRNNPFGSRITTIHTTMYSCILSTAKEGFFKRQSSMILELPLGELSPYRAVAKIIYAPSLFSSDRLQLHDVIAQSLDESGESMSLGEAIDGISEFLKKRGAVSELINIA